MKVVFMGKIKDWSQAEIKSALILKGITLRQISKNAGKSETAASKALTKPWPEMRRKIAAALETPPQNIWPSSFDENGKLLVISKQVERTHGA